MKQRIYFSLIAGLATLLLLNSFSLLFSSFYVMKEVIDRGISKDVANSCFDLAVSHKTSHSFASNQTLDAKPNKRHLTSSNQEQGQKTYLNGDRAQQESKKERKERQQKMNMKMVATE